MTASLTSSTDRPYQLLPPLDMEQRHLLKQSIEKNGVLEPVVFDEDGEILDGHHRVEIAEELGIEYPRRVIDGLDQPSKYMYALTVNVARRQLDQAARGSLVAQMRVRGMSIRGIAEALGVSRGTVANDLAQVSKVGHLPEQITGSDGKSYASSRPTPKTPGADGAAKVPPSVPGTTPEPVAPVDVPTDATGSGPTADMAARLPDAVLSVLADVDHDLGLAAMEVWARLPMPGVHSSWVEPVLVDLADDGRAVMQRTSGGDRWMLTPEPDADLSAAQSGPEPAPAVEARPLREPDPEQARLVANARRKAQRLVAEVSSAINEIEIGIAFGEPGLATAEMVAGLRAQADRLEQYLKEKKA